MVLCGCGALPGGCCCLLYSVCGLCVCFELVCAHACGERYLSPAASRRSACASCLCLLVVHHVECQTSERLPLNTCDWSLGPGCLAHAVTVV